MEKRIGSALILIRDNAGVTRLNEILSFHSSIIIGRQGIPLRDKKINLISLVLEGSTDEISALTGQIGRLPGMEIKSVLTRFKEQHSEEI